ncbi:MurR/RpiR family transcriptional regulator [Halomonas sp. NO4]|uniref:MurR/RpiR family transcriptional regulator n=1 Tax=Halomonas sp. NO4 TaxID=2484813 RepID=UPI0013D8BCAC|nr:MurR/RpiR family transcriptional regulator [Halomonas sp. NO4]
MTTADDTPSLEARIQAHYSELPPAEKRLGDLLLSFPGDIATYSAGELAEAAGTSKAAASRFFQRLGYKDFNAARQQARDAKRWGSPVYLSSGAAPSRQSVQPPQPSQLIADHVAQETQNLTHTLEALRPDRLRACVTALATAQRVHVAGFRNSHMLASYLHRQLQLLRPDVVLLPKSGQTLGEDLVDITTDDVVILVGLRRRVSLVSRILDVAREQGARSLLITDPSAVDPGLTGTWTFTCQVRSQSLFDSYSATMSVINLLCTTLYQYDVPQSQSRLKRIEALHDELEELNAYP